MAGFLKEKIEYYRQHWFVRNVATLQVGSFAGNFLQAIIGIFIARILQPELFGVYSLAFSMAAMGSIIIGAGMADAMASILGGAYARDDKDEIKSSLAFLLKIVIYASLITIALSPLLPFFAHKWYGDSTIGYLALIILLAAMISSTLFSLTQIVLQVIQKINILTFINFFDQLIRYGLSLIFVFLGLGVAGAISGHLIGAMILFAILLFIWKKINLEFISLPSLRELIVVSRNISIKRYFKFSFWVALDRNMGNIYMALPVVLVGVYSIIEEVTFFKLAFGFVNLALSLLGPISVLLNVEFPKMQAGSRDKMIYNFIKVSLYSMILSAILTTGAVVVSPFAFKILYGENFMPSVKYVYGLIIYGALYGIGVGLGPMWRAVNKVKISIMINSFILGIGIPVGLLLIKSYGAWGGVLTVTLWFTLSHFISFIYLARKLNKLSELSNL